MFLRFQDMTKKRTFDEMSQNFSTTDQETNFQKKLDTDLWAEAYLKITETFKKEYNASYQTLHTNFL